jgi:hypothetical protein
MTDDNTRPASLDAREAIFTSPFDREIRVSADRQTIAHRAMDWSGTYTPARLLTWIQFYEHLAKDPAMPRAKAEVEVLHTAGICWRMGHNT